ncbi:MAG: rhamnulokinase [Bacteroidales bacterium 52_46]|nr:MAG: rhamnulokinase [Bacteroidales bacterium 52_46]
MPTRSTEIKTGTPAYIAVDFGGGSGRVIAGIIDDANALRLVEIHRFPNRQVRCGGRLYWDFLSLYAEMLEGLRKAVASGLRLRSIGIDTWGVDFGLIDNKGNLICNPVCYRDEAVEGIPEEFYATHSRSAHYAVNGTQVMAINTMFRLMALHRDAPVLINAASHLLFMPDLFSFYLTGRISNEYTIASTSGLLNASTRQWDYDFIDKLGLPCRLFGDIVMPGTSRGVLKRDVSASIGVDYPVEVIAVGSHDTASAVFATATSDDMTAWLSSGTWSLLGIDLPEPVLTEEARAAGFTNEGAVGGRIRFLQNITGLWMLQRLMAAWSEKGNPIGIVELINEAENADIDTVVDVDDPVFASAADMETIIADYCRRNGLRIPATRGEFARTVISSLSQRYARGIRQLDTFLPSPVKKLRIMGGGSRNKLLNRLTAEAAGIEVEAADVEATAIGNILVQAIADGRVTSRDDLTSVTG